MMAGGGVSMLALYALTNTPSAPTIALGVLAGAIIGEALRSVVFR
jgi:hypothetical protein